MSANLWTSRQAVGLHRISVAVDEAVHVLAGFAMHAPVRVFRLDGLLVLDGLLIVRGFDD